MSFRFYSDHEKSTSQRFLSKLNPERERRGCRSFHNFSTSGTQTGTQI